MERIDHIAIAVPNIARAVKWYTDNFDCKTKYKDRTWAVLEFDNIDLALVNPAEHPPHIAFVDEDLKDEHVTHRDGSKAKYEHDGFGNMIEKIKYKK